MNPTQLAHDVKAVRDLIESRGWAILKEIQEREILEVAKQMGTPGMTPDQMHYRSGVLWSAQKLLQLPESVLMRLEGDLAMATTGAIEPTSTGGTS